MINATHLPQPDALHLPSFETLVNDNNAIIKSLLPDYVPLESDDIQLIIQAFAYRELMLRSQFNARLSSMLLPFATESNLDTVATFYGVTRLASETDNDFRSRIFKSLDGHSTAGSVESYAFAALSVDSVIDDVQVFSPEIGKVTVAITSFSQSVTPELIAKVSEHLNADKVRPITDSVTVVAATQKAVNLVIDLIVFDLNATEQISANVAQNFKVLLRIGQSLTYSQMVKFCHVDGVYKATLNVSDDIECADAQILTLADLQINITGFNDG